MARSIFNDPVFLSRICVCSTNFCSTFRGADLHVNVGHILKTDVNHPKASERNSFPESPFLRVDTLFSLALWFHQSWSSLWHHVAARCLSQTASLKLSRGAFSNWSFDILPHFFHMPGVFISRCNYFVLCNLLDAQYLHARLFFCSTFRNHTTSS